MQLNVINRKLASGTVDIPPEGERSPSPPPIYDVMGMRCASLLHCRCTQLSVCTPARLSVLLDGACLCHVDHHLPPDSGSASSPLPCRLNTREVRYKEKMVKARSKLIEQLIQRDSTYKPPAGALGKQKSSAWAGFPIAGRPQVPLPCFR